MDQEFLNPVNILNQLYLREDTVACDFGCGSGGWVVPLAKILSKGKVFAVDILQEPLSALEEKLRREKLFNVSPMLADAEKGVKIMEDSVDLVLLTNILFQAEERNKILEESKRILKSEGKALVVDWKPESPVGPRERVSKEDAIKLAAQTGLGLEKEIEAGKYHWGVIFVKI
jgi:ubiquinone/menaquinone biosynthesis C-methylase UbiE